MDLRDFIGVTVTVVWAVTTFADVLILDYDPPVGVQPVMMLVAGAVFVDKIRRPGGGQAKEPSEEIDA